MKKSKRCICGKRGYEFQALCSCGKKLHTNAESLSYLNRKYYWDKYLRKLEKGL